MGNESLERRPRSQVALSFADEIKRVLDESDLWHDDLKYIEVGDSYSRRRWEYAWLSFCREKKIDILVATFVAVGSVVVTLVTGTAVIWNLVAGIGGIVLGLVLTLAAFWVGSPGTELEFAL